MRESDKFVLAEVDTEALTDGAVIFVVRRDGACYREFAEYPADSRRKGGKVMVVKPKSGSSVGNQEVRKAIVNPKSSDSASHWGGLLHSSPSRTTSAAVKFKGGARPLPRLRAGFPDRPS